MLVQIIDVDYIMIDNKPVIRIFGKRENNESICVFYEGFMPYFYVAGQNAEKILEKEGLDYKKVKRNVIMKLEQVEMFKITLRDPSKTPEIREKLKNHGLVPYEADILFKYRFMADFGLNGLGWIDVKGSSINTTTVSSHAILADEIKPIERAEDADLKTLVFDLECVTSNRPGSDTEPPDSKKDPIILISIVLSHKYKGKKKFVLGTRAGSGIEYFPDEAAMLEEMVKIINTYDPDIISGYNVNGFDFPYFIERLRQNKIDSIFGRCKQKKVFTSKMGMMNKVYITGRIIADVYGLVKRDFSLKRYDLDTAARALIGEGKVDVKYSEIKKLWTGSQEEYEKLVGYALKDSELAMKLLNMNLLDKHIALSKVSGTLLQDTLNGGETQRIENYLLRAFNKKNYAIPCRPEPEEVGMRSKRKKDELKGGFVIEPKKGLHTNVVVLDFKSMYPTMIETFNICPTTYSEKKVEGKTLETPSGYFFYKKEVKMGIVPELLHRLMKERGIVKKKMKTCKDEKILRTLDAHQYALKIMSNAFYGYLGYVRAKLYFLEIANAVTSSGRKLIQDTARKVEKRFKYKIIYGDTDSVMVKIHDKEELDDIAVVSEKIVDNINKELPGSLELEFEKVFKRFLPLSKKRYAAWCFEQTSDGWKDKIDMKGIETVRRDWCELVSDTMKKIIEIILIKNDSKAAMKYFKSVVDSLMKGEVDIQKLAVTKSISRSVEKYAGIQPHVEVVKKMQKRMPGEAPSVGDRVSYVIVKGMGLVSKRAEDPGYIVEHGLPIDSQYYINNQLLPPLERIFSGLGISKSELLGNGKQMGLFEAINGNGKEKEEPKVAEVMLNEINGFICKKCNEFYRRVPLSGHCECGNEVVFSSPKGPVKTIIVE